MNYRNVSTRGLDNAASTPPASRSSPSMTFATRMARISCRAGLDLVGVQRQMGHARPSITMDLHVHEFEAARRGEQVSDRLTAALGGLVESDKF